MVDNTSKGPDPKSQKTDGVRRPETKPVLKNPKKAGESDSPSSLGQSIEAGGVD